MALACAPAWRRPSAADHGAADSPHPRLEPADLGEPGRVSGRAAVGNGRPALLRRFDHVAVGAALVLAHRPPELGRPVLSVSRQQPGERTRLAVISGLDRTAPRPSRPGPGS